MTNKTDVAIRKLKMVIKTIQNDGTNRKIMIQNSKLRYEIQKDDTKFKTTMQKIQNENKKSKLRLKILIDDKKVKNAITTSKLPYEIQNDDSKNQNNNTK